MQRVGTYNGLLFGRGGEWDEGVNAGIFLAGEQGGTHYDVTTCCDTESKPELHMS